MANTVRIYVEDVTTQLLTYTQIRVYRDTSPEALSLSSTIIATIALVADQENYEFIDASGTADSYYAYTFHDPVAPAETALSERFRGSGTTLERLRMYAAREAGWGWEGTSGQSTTSSVLHAPELADSAVDDKYAEGAWIYRPGAVAADKVRAVSSFDVTSRLFTPSRTWGVFAAGETYQVFGLAPPIDHPGQPFSWDRAVANAFSTRWCKFIDQLNLGNGTSTGTQEFSLATHLGYMNPDNDIRKVLLRTFDNDGEPHDLDHSKNGRWWRLINNGPADVKLWLNSAPREDETVIVEVRRQPSRPYVDSDVIDCPFELAWRAVRWAMFRSMNVATSGKYVTDEQFALDELMAEHRERAVRGVVLI